MNESWKEQRHQAKAAFVRARLFVLGGICVGFSLLSVAKCSEFLRHHFHVLDWPALELFEMLVEHLGAGFFVSAIAVFAYEWAAHAHHAIGVSEKALDLINDKIRPITSAVGREAVIRAR